MPRANLFNWDHLQDLMDLQHAHAAASRPRKRDSRKKKKKPTPTPGKTRKP
jgi:hypothetical protein